MKYLLTSVFALFLVSATSVTAQQSNYRLLDKSTMKIEGTSTIHDWTVDVNEINADITFKAAALEGESSSNPVKSLSLTIPVEKLDSGKGGMNNKIYDALKKKKNPNIKFKLTSAEVTNRQGADFTLSVTGPLTIAGFTRDITFPVQGSIENGTYKFTGSYELNMKDYEIDPPSAVFGTIRSGEMVTVSFEFYIGQ